MLSNASRRIVLASGSPRRRELLQGLGFELDVRPANIPEEPLPDESGAAYTARLAQEKAAATAAALPDDAPKWTLAADTTVVCDGEILEKPTDADDAVRMLSALKGRWHEVTTSFCWRHRDGREAVESVTTRVKFRDVAEDRIRRYVATGEPMDKAGAYGIQGLGEFLVERIDGSYTCVVGLPMSHVIASLDALGGLEEFPFNS